MVSILQSQNFRASLSLSLSLSILRGKPPPSPARCTTAVTTLCRHELKFENICSNGRELWGWFFLVIDSFSFVGFVFAAVISKLLLPSANVFVSAIQNDGYYCLLVPLTLPIVVVAGYFHWLGMKLFMHA